MRPKALFAAGLLAVLCANVAMADTPGPRFLDRHAAYPEGPLLRADGLYVAEMGADRVSVYAEGRKRTYWRRNECGPTSIAPYRDGLLVLCHLAGAVAVVDASGATAAMIDRDAQGRRFRDPNDSYADGRGGVYFSDPGAFTKDSRPNGALIYLDAAGAARRVAAGLWYPNGVYVDQSARQLYVSETFNRRILRYPIREDGALGPQEIYIDIDAAAPAATRYREPYREAGPDGLEIAPNGHLFVAMYGEGRILEFDAQGGFLSQIRTRARYVTNLAFAPDGGFYRVGPLDNVNPPYAGEVVYQPPPHP